MKVIQPDVVLIGEPIECERVNRMQEELANSLDVVFT